MYSKMLSELRRKRCGPEHGRDFQKFKDSNRRSVAVQDHRSFDITNESLRRVVQGAEPTRGSSVSLLSKVQWRFLRHRT